MAENERDEQQQTGTSRRNALKAGLAAGVGVVAWSGPTITSIGGTPAYAATCTNFTVNASDTDRNTSQAAGCLNAGGSLDYKPPSLTLPAGYSFGTAWFSNSGFCNDTRFNNTLSFPPGSQCTVTIRVHENGLFNSGPWYYNFTFISTPPAATLDFFVPATSDYTTTVGINANSRWSIRVQCSTVPGCF